MAAVIEVTGLTKRYGGKRVQAVVDGISFHVDKGEIFGILGPNGAGKTTVVECLEGLRKRDDGQVRILGLDPRTDGHRLHQRIGVQLQETQLQDKLKVREALELYASFYPDPADWRELLERWGLTGKSGTSFAKLSGGQKQRLFIALALVGNPEVVFLDELTAGLDPGARRATWDLISQVRAQGVTVVLVSHFMDEVEELCDRVAILERGRIAALDTPAGLVDRAGGEYRVRFRPMAPLDEQSLTALPGVVSVSRRGAQVDLSGTGDFASAVTAELARRSQVIRLLIADDHPVVRDGLRGIFEASGEFEVAGEAANGREAVDRAAALRPDVVLMDLRMPVLDGVSAIRLLAEKGVSARVLVLTTFDTDTDVEPAIEAGATGYLLKDSPPDELLRGVRAAARGEAVLSPSVATRLLGQVRQPAREPLSQRELDILGLIARGCSNREAAARLFISEATVKTHLLHIYAKLGVNDRAAAVATGFERGLLPRP